MAHPVRINARGIPIRRIAYHDSTLTHSRWPLIAPHVRKALRKFPICDLF